ncbi:hypothetical protein D3C77_617260 [compost metagenome]
MELREYLVRQVPLGLQALRGLQVQQELQVHPGLQVPLGLQGLQEPQALLALRDQLEFSHHLTVRDLAGLS